MVGVAAVMTSGMTTLLVRAEPEHLARCTWLWRRSMACWAPSLTGLEQQS